MPRMHEWTLIVLFVHIRALVANALEGDRYPESAWRGDFRSHRITVPQLHLADGSGVCFWRTDIVPLHAALAEQLCLPGGSQSFPFCCFRVAGICVGCINHWREVLPGRDSQSGEDVEGGVRRLIKILDNIDLNATNARMDTNGFIRAFVAKVHFPVAPSGMACI